MYLHIEQLSVETLIGAYAWERQMKQKLLVDIQITLPPLPKNSDELSDVLDYADFSEQIKNWFFEQSFVLIERLMSAFLEDLKEKWPDHQFFVTIYKPGAVKNAKNLSLSASTAD